MDLEKQTPESSSAEQTPALQRSAVPYVKPELKHLGGLRELTLPGTDDVLDVLIQGGTVTS